MTHDHRRALLLAALGFLQLAPRVPGLVALLRWLDSWAALGLVATGMHRQGDVLGGLRTRHA